MGLLELIITVAIVGIVLWLVETYVPMDAGIKRLLQIIVILIVAVWLLQSLGLLGHVSGEHINDVRIK